MKTAPPSRTADQFVVRMPEGMRKRIEAAAKVSGRSMNAEIVSMLAKGLEPSALDLATVPDGLLLDEAVRRYGAQVQIVVAPEVAAAAGIKPKRAKGK